MSLSQLFICVCAVIGFCIFLGFVDAAARKALRDCQAASPTVNCEYLIR